MHGIKGKKSVIEIIEDRLYYEQLGQGKDPKMAINDSSNLNYSEISLNDAQNEVHGNFNKKITITLADAIKGFPQGVAGMSIGERRKIYELAYGKAGGPQELIIFEVERISK